MSLRTVAEFVSGGINKVTDLQDSLQSAIELEFSTIPPYLCAEWSIKDPADPVARMMHSIVLQEMLHMGLACNMLTAIGGNPSIAKPAFIPAYPTDGLPGNVHPHLRVDLAPLGPASLDIFMQIEWPERGPLAFAALDIFPTIGEFYDTIAAAFQALNPPIQSGKQVTANLDQDRLFAITSVADALKAIKEIRQQGEGTTSSPFAAEFNVDELAHFYLFKEIATAHRLQQGGDGAWHFDGPAIPMPATYQFTDNENPTSDNFNIIFSDLLRLLEKAWTQDPKAISAAEGQMFGLQAAGVALIQAGNRPGFRWTDTSHL